MPDLGIADTVFAPAEALVLKSAPPALQRVLFFRLWTLKESFIKATGEGLSSAAAFLFLHARPGSDPIPSRMDRLSAERRPGQMAVRRIPSLTAPTSGACGSPRGIPADTARCASRATAGDCVTSDAEWPLPVTWVSSRDGEVGYSVSALERVRRRLAGSDDGDQKMVAIPAAVLTGGLSAVEAACAQAMADGVHSADVIINILTRQRDPGPAAIILTPAALTLRHMPIADCARYDQLRS